MNDDKFTWDIFGLAEDQETFPIAKNENPSKKEKHMTSKEFSTTSIQNFQRIDENEGVIYGASLMTTGVAKGHGMLVDRKTLEQIRDVGSKYEHGLRCNIGHKTSLSDAIARIDNLRIDNDKLLGDVHLDMGDNRSKKILWMAKEMPDTFGFSMAFGGEDEKKDGKIFARCDEIYSADLVCTPAANPAGLFEAKIEPEMSLKEFTEALTRIVKNFENPNVDDQPRDETGKWTSGGGIGSEADKKDTRPIGERIRDSRKPIGDQIRQWKKGGEAKEINNLISKEKELTKSIKSKASERKALYRQLKQADNEDKHNAISALIDKKVDEQIDLQSQLNDVKRKLYKK